MTIKTNSQAMRSATVAFKLMNKSVGKSPVRRSQIKSTAKTILDAVSSYQSKQQTI